VGSNRGHRGQRGRPQPGTSSKVRVFGMAERGMSGRPGCVVARVVQTVSEQDLVSPHPQTGAASDGRLHGRMAR